MIATIELLNDLPELYKLRTAISERIETLEKQRHEEAVAQAWEWVKNRKPGDTLYCCASGTFLGGPLQRGDKVEVLAIQPRAKRLWVLKNKKTLFFKPSGVHRYNLRPDPPANPASDFERRLGNAAGKIIQSLDK